MLSTFYFAIVLLRIQAFTVVCFLHSADKGMLHDRQFEKEGNRVVLHSSEYKHSLENQNKTSFQTRESETLELAKHVLCTLYSKRCQKCSTRDAIETLQFRKEPFRVNIVKFEEPFKGLKSTQRNLAGTLILRL